MTNQASELDKAIMIGFLYGIQSDLLPEDEVVHRMVAFSHTKGYKEALAIIRTEKLKLLAEVRRLQKSYLSELTSNDDDADYDDFVATHSAALTQLEAEL